MSKNIELDKFYTPKETAKKCIDIFNDTFKNITEIIEPSAGNGSFSLHIPNCISYDLEPEHESITKQDFLKLDLPYKQGRAIIGNPPFGNRNNLALKFFKKSIKSCDYIGFILPISQLNNIDSFYEFDLISSYDLGILEYSGMKVRCCFNVYKRPYILNKKPRLKSDLFSLHRDNRDNFENTEEDFVICRWGDIGKIVELKNNKHKQVFKVVVYDKKNLNYVKNKIINYDWLNYKSHQSAPSLSKNDVYRLFST